MYKNPKAGMVGGDSRMHRNPKTWLSSAAAQFKVITAMHAMTGC